jgi:hypothetical protein
MDIAFITLFSPELGCGSDQSSSLLSEMQDFDITWQSLANTDVPGISFHRLGPDNHRK